MSTIKMCLVALLLAALGSFAWAAQTQTAIDVTGLPPVVITAQAAAASVLATDTGTNGSKRDHVVSLTTVDGWPVVLLVRIERAPNGIFLDIIGEASIGELATRVAALSITGSSHPSPTDDAIDTATITAAGG